MTIVEAFGARLQNIRKAQKLSQEKLAENSGLHRTYISSLERGKRNPTLITLQALAKALDIKIAYLVSEIENE
jgi:transcriptional regulator with XRE-family HTH domain